MPTDQGSTENLRVTIALVSGILGGVAVDTTLSTALVLVLVANPAAAQPAPPLPPPRPNEALSPVVSPSAKTEVLGPVSHGDDDCLRRLKSAGFDVEATEH